MILKSDVERLIGPSVHPDNNVASNAEIALKQAEEEEGQTIEEEPIAEPSDEAISNEAEAEETEQKPSV